MVNKLLVTTVDGIKGTDYRSNKFNSREEFLDESFNPHFKIRQQEGISLAKRPGRVVRGQPLGQAYIHKWAYFNTTNGLNKETVIAANGAMWELVDYELTLNGPYSFRYSVEFDVSDEEFKLKIYNSSDELQETINLENGIDTNFKNIGQLFAEINALSGFSVTLPAQTLRKLFAYSTGSEQTIANGGTFNNIANLSGVSVGTIISGWCKNTETFRYGVVTAVNSGANQVTCNFLSKEFKTTGIVENWTLEVNSGLGVAGVPAASLPLTDIANQSLATSQKVTVQAWIPVYMPLLYSCFNISATDLSLVHAQKGIPVRPTFTNGRNAAYVCSYNRFPVKFDSKRAYVAGVKITDTTISTSTGLQVTDFPYLFYTVIGAGSILAGTYRYRCVAAFEDGLGSTIYGPTSPSQEVSFSSSQSVEIGCDNIFQWLNTDHTVQSSHYMVEKVASPVSSSNNIPLTNDTALTGALNAAVYGEVGDFVYIQNKNLSAPEYTTEAVRRKITAISGNTITVDGAALTLNAGSLVSFGGHVKLLRTLAGGTVYYEIGTYVLDPTQGIVQYMKDNKNDTAVLNTSPRYELPLTSQERNPPPKATFMTLHDGLAFYGGNPEDPNAIYFSLPSSGSTSIEHVPAAFNQFIIQTRSGQQVSAIGSDNAGRLIVFSPTSVFQVIGDYLAFQFGIDEIASGRYGVSNQGAIAQTSSGLVCFGEGGVFAVKGGIIIPIAYQVNNRLHHKPNFNYNFVTVVDDYINQCIRVLYSVEFERVLDYTLTEGLYFSETNLTSSNDFYPGWWTWKSTRGTTMTDGVVVYERQTYGINNDKANGTNYLGRLFCETDQHYNDNHFPIEFLIESGYLTLGDLFTEKEFSGVHIFSELNENDIEVHYKSWRSSDWKVAKPDTSTEEVVVSLDDITTKGLKVRVYQNKQNQPVAIYGYGIEAGLPNVPDQISKGHI